MADYVVLGSRIAAGLLAGLYFAFAVAVMPALHGSDGATFADTMNRINVSIVNPAFLAVFLAAPLLAVVAAALGRAPVLYVAAGLALLTLLITVGVNVPLNDKLAAGASRANFEGPWVRANILRTLTGITSFVLLLLPRSPGG